jgi:hypothetical protein
VHRRPTPPGPGHRRAGPDRDPDAEAVTLLSFADGLVSLVLVGHYGADTALAAIDCYLDRLLTGQRVGPGR